MNLLKEVIDLLGKEEVKHYKVLTERTRKGQARKDLQLFDAFRKAAKGFDEDQVFSRLFEKSSKNAFYRLKNKVLNDLTKALFFLHADKDEQVQIQQLLAIGRFFMQKGHSGVAYHFLHKAEKQAKKAGNLELLDMIFGELIKLTKESFELNPEHYIHQREQIQGQLRRMQELDQLIAVVKHRIHLSYNMATKESKVMDLLQQTIDDFNNDEQLLREPENQLKLYEAISNLLIHKKDYKTLAHFAKTTYERFVNQRLFNRKNHEEKLRMLCYIVNSLSKTGQYEESLSYANTLEMEMRRYNNLHYNKYRIYYYSALILNYSKTDPEKTIDFLKAVKDEPQVRQLPSYPVFINMNLASMYHETGYPKKALKQLDLLLQDAHFQQVDRVFQLKVKVFELLLNYELGDLDIIPYKINYLKQDYRNTLMQENFRELAKISAFLEVLDLMSTTLYWKNDDAIKGQAKAFLENYPNEDEETLIDLNRWLSNQLNQVPESQ